MTANLPTHYESEQVEQTVKQRWEEQNAYQYVKDKRAGDEPFSFIDGPPFTTGRMHVGNAWGKVLKDALLRYERMCGNNVVARPGYDTHGLPVEVKVEEEHDFATKKDVEDYGVENFIEECRAFAESQQAHMTEEFRDLGVWMDWDETYATLDPEYMETVWSAFKAVYEQDMVTREKRVVNACPRCETALADSELEYAMRSVTATYVGFPLTDETAHLVAWTTTPWTVVGNEFVAVNQDVEYARVVLSDGTSVYLATESVSEVMDSLDIDEYNVVETLSGEALVGREYDHPLADELPNHPDTRGCVAHAEYVDTEKTGVVHSAPGFGHEDFERGQVLDLPVFSPVSNDGTFTTDAGPYAGLNVREAVVDLLDDLDDTGALFGTEEYTHEYPQCPRCDTDVLYRASEQWLVAVTEVKDELLDTLNDVDWRPEDARDTRFRNVVEEAPDWNVSRQRYWGTPLPVWVCQECFTETVVGSRQEFVERSDLDQAPDDLHRPAVDDVVLDCRNCGGDARRVEDVLDVWFDSAVASWASRDALPHETPVPDLWPADLAVEGQDQVRGWFLMQLYLGVLLADRPPYERVLMHGFAMLDGKAMSKSRGHVLRPPTVVDEHGRDALRVHLLRHEQHEQDVNMISDLSGVREVRGRLDVVWNTFRFAIMYMKADDYDPQPSLTLDTGDRTAVDSWVLSRLTSVVDEATEAFGDLRPNDALESTLSFLVEDVSRYYVQSVRDRVWTTEMTAEKAQAYDTLGTVLHATVRLLAPFAPFLSDRLYDALNGDEPTVHATDWPHFDGDLRDEQLESELTTLRSVEKAVSKARQKAGRKHRWPVPEVVVEPATPVSSLGGAVEAHEDHLEDRLNAKSVRVTSDFEETSRRVVPDMSSLGPEFGETAPDVADSVRGALVTEVPLTVEVNGEVATVTREQVNVEEHVPERFEVAEFNDGTVYVDTSLSTELRREGMARDVVRRYQSMRQSMGLSFDDSVVAHVGTESEEVAAAVQSHRGWILEEVRAKALSDEPQEYAETWEVDGASVKLSLSKVGVPTSS